MADALDILQAVGIIAALGFAGFELWSRKRELAFRNYLDSIAAYGESARVIVDQPDLLALYDGDPRYAALDTAAKRRANFCDWIIGMCETVYEAEKRGWLRNEWPYWQQWLEELYRDSADFRWTWQWVTVPRSDYNPDFVSRLRAAFTATAQRSSS